MVVLLLLPTLPLELPVDQVMHSEGLYTAREIDQSSIMPRMRLRSNNNTNFSVPTFYMLRLNRVFHLESLMGLGLV